MKILVTAALAASLAGPVTAEPGHAPAPSDRAAKPDGLVTVAAETPCGDRLRAIAALKMHYGEHRRMVGLSDNGLLIEVWGNEATGTWTVTGTTAAGILCVLMTGDGLEALPGGELV